VGFPGRCGFPGATAAWKRPESRRKSPPGSERFGEDCFMGVSCLVWLRRRSVSPRRRNSSRARLSWASAAAVARPQACAENRSADWCANGFSSRSAITRPTVEPNMPNATAHGSPRQARFSAWRELRMPAAREAGMLSPFCPIQRSAAGLIVTSDRGARRHGQNLSARPSCKEDLTLVLLSADTGGSGDQQSSPACRAGPAGSGRSGRTGNGRRPCAMFGARYRPRTLAAAGQKNWLPGSPRPTGFWCTKYELSVTNSASAEIISAGSHPAGCPARRSNHFP